MRKKCMALLLACALLLSLLPAAGAASAVPSGNLDVDRAVSYGLVPQALQGDWDQAVTYRQFFDLLDGLVAKTAPDQAAAWKSLTAGAPAGAIPRKEAMLACMLAGWKIGAPDAVQYSLETGVDLGAMLSDKTVTPSKFYADWAGPVSLEPGENGDFENAVVGGLFYGMRQTSKVTGLSLFTPTGDQMRPDAPLTRAEAAQAAARLYESRAYPTQKAQTNAVIGQVRALPQLQDDFSAADARRTAILNSPTAIVKSGTSVKGETYTATAYYLSNSGDDTRDGRSPETAWATLERLNAAELRYGDAVFFERGGLWRSAAVQTRPGVTYSAYGQGEKPRLYGSDENGSGAEKWKLYASTPDGGKIWVYYRDMLDCAAVVMDGGEAWTTREAPFWNGSAFVDYHGSGAPIEAAAWLTRDMTTFSDARSALPAKLPLHAAFESGPDAFDMLKNAGPLYLRCDAGNPGALYDEIEFLLPYCPFDGLAADCVLDNLSMMYSGCGGVFTGQNGNRDGVIQNCEFGWMGGRVASYLYEGYTANEDGHTVDQPGVQQNGGALAIGDSHYRIRNNYVHHTYNEGLSIETGIHTGDPSVTGVTFDGNLLEYCVSALLLCNWDVAADPAHSFRDCAYRDNDVLFSGYEAFGDVAALGRGMAAFSSSGGPNLYTGDLRVSGNRFLFSTGQLLAIDELDPRYGRIYDGNTYVQHADGNWVWLVGAARVFYGDQAQTAFRDLLGDGAGRILPVSS